LRWQRKISVEPEIWVPDHPSLPVWFVEYGGQVPDSVFLDLWTQNPSVLLMKKILFWWSVTEIEQKIQLLELTVDESIESTQPSPLVVESTTVQSRDGEYDPMRALLAAQESRPFNPQRQFETIEGGRFRAKH
jgi:hypothetical protein